MRGAKGRWGEVLRCLIHKGDRIRACDASSRQRFASACFAERAALALCDAQAADGFTQSSAPPTRLCMSGRVYVRARVRSRRRRVCGPHITPSSSVAMHRRSGGVGGVHGTVHGTGREADERAAGREGSARICTMRLRNESCSMLFVCDSPYPPLLCMCPRRS